MFLLVVAVCFRNAVVPVHVASYRERGVLRRLAAAGFPRWSFAIAQVASSLVLTVAALVVLRRGWGSVPGPPTWSWSPSCWWYR